MIIFNEGHVMDFIILNYCMILVKYLLDNKHILAEFL